MKHEIKCPNCGKLFQIDESDYHSIVNQIKNQEFQKELEEKEKILKSQQETELKLLKSEEDKKHESELREKDIAYQELLNHLNEKEKDIVSLKKQIELQEETKNGAIAEAVAKEKEKNQAKDLELANLQKELEKQKLDNELEITKAVNEKDKEIATLNHRITEAQTNYVEKENDLKNQYEVQLKMKDEEIERYRDFKAKQSTKMIGESLEVHCANEFNKLRPLFANAYFDKDNAVSKDSSSKGDFIYRDYDDEGNEFISIMFEMKNEADATEKKHKNEDFLKELDKDRNEKNCEYAILVSMLEADSDLYNNGIVDMSHKYPKMYVIRPQFFISIITLLRNAALNSVQYRKALVQAQNQNIDIANFEENVNTFKDAFSKNYELASRKFTTAIEEIDKSIDHLQKIKDNLLSSDRNLRLANDKAQDLSIKKLTKNAPSVAARFQEEKKKKSK